MPTFQELASSYAQRIRDAVELDGFQAKNKIISEEIKKSRTLQVAKDINREIDGLVYTSNNQPLSESDKRAIKELIDRSLRLPKIRQEGYALEAASNDNLSDLADVIENILSGNK